MFRAAAWLAVCLLAAGPAQACKCDMTNADQYAQKILDDPSYIIAQAQVLSVHKPPPDGMDKIVDLKILSVSRGTLPLGAAKAATGGTSCDVWPKAGDTKQTFLIRRKPDGGLRLVGDCASAFLRRAGKM